MPLGPFLEPKLLDQLLGCCVAQCNSVIGAGTAAQTTFNLRGSSGAGSADLVPANNDIWLFVTPGSGATQNQYTNPDVFLATGGSGTTITFASRTIVAARAVGDFGFRLMTTTAFDRFAFYNTVYVGLSTVGATTAVAAASDLASLPQGTINVASTGVANGGGALTNGGSFTAAGTILVDSSNGLQTIAYTGVTATSFTGCTGGTGVIDTTSTVVQAPTQAQILAAEPTSAGSYARVAAVNNPTNFTPATGSVPALKVNGASLGFPASTAPWSSGAAVLNMYFVADASTLAGGNILFYGYLTTAQQVNASGITPNLGPSGLSVSLL